MNLVLKEQRFPSGTILQLVQGDITAEAVDAIVNAANANLRHGGGVAGVISRRGGPEIQAESNAWVRERGPVRHAEPAYTGAGALPCRYVIHAVGPVWGEGDEDAKLSAAIMGSLRLGEQLGIQSMALPAISTGIFAFPKERAAKVIFAAIERYFVENPETELKQIRLTLLDQESVHVFGRAMESLGWGGEPG